MARSAEALVRPATIVRFENFASPMPGPSRAGGGRTRSCETGIRDGQGQGCPMGLYHEAGVPMKAYCEKPRLSAWSHRSHLDVRSRQRPPVHGGTSPNPWIARGVSPEEQARGESVRTPFTKCIHAVQMCQWSMLGQGGRRPWRHSLYATGARRWPGRQRRRGDTCPDSGRLPTCCRAAPASGTVYANALL